MSDELDLVRLLRHEADTAVDAIDRVRRQVITHAQAAATADERAFRTVQIIPYLIYEDVERAVDWLSRAFGFGERAQARLVGASGRVERTDLELGGAVVSVGRPSIHGDSPSLGVSTMLEVTIAAIDDHYERARAAGAVIVIELEETPWGVRRYQARDLEGHNWHFSEPQVGES